MKAEEVTLLETTVRAANPYPSVEAVAASEELVRMDALVRLGTSSGPVPRRTGPQTRSGWAVAGFAFAVVLVIGFGLALLRAPFGGEDVTVTDQPTTTVASVITTLATSPVVELDSWQRVGADVMQPVVGLFDMTQVGSWLIAVGFDPGEEDLRQNGVIFSSDDGVIWSRLAQDDPALTLGAVLMYGIAEGGPGMVAVGMGCEDDTAPCAAYPTVWTSVDGTSWTRTSADPDIFGESGAMMDVAATDYGIVAVGSIGELGPDDAYFTRSSVWLSADGVNWTRVWEDDLVDASASPSSSRFSALAVDPDGLIVGVGEAENQNSELVAAVWVSIDGHAWERVEPNPSAFGSENGLDVFMLDVAWSSDGFTAVGTEGGTQPAIWKSPDGLSWTRIDAADQPFDATGTISSVAALDAGFVAAGPHGFADQKDGPVTLWTSRDGSIWDRVHTTGSGYAMSIVVTDAGIAVAGGMPEDNDFHAAVWAGPAFDPDNPPSDPLPSSPPTTVEEPSTGLAEIGTLDEGLSCEELATPGYSYAEAVAYWMWRDKPADLDPDANGLPCEDAYSASDVIDVYGEPDAHSVQLIASHSTGTFIATGPAVEAGIICATGSIDYTEDPEPIGLGVLLRWEDIYTCEDNSGTFILGVDEYIVIEPAMYGIWNIVSGTGNYQSMNGGGGTDSIFGDYDISMGRLWFPTDEN